jgi:hypothetical protein
MINGDKRPLSRRKNLIILFLLSVFSLCIAGALTRMAYLRYTGFCFVEERYLSPQEKINKVVSNLLNQFPKEVYKTPEAKFSELANDWESKYGIPGVPIPYKDSHEFFRLNPNCCHLSSVIKDENGLIKIGFWDRLLWGISEFVFVTYSLRYLDRNGDEKTMSVKTHSMVSGCGEIEHF